MGRIIKITSDILFISGLVIAGLFLVGRFTGKLPLKVYIVSSGSMAPAIQTGSVVFVAPKSDYGVGDIVTYQSGSKTTTTHRIVARNGDKIKLAGDANNAPDPGIINSEKVIGTVRFSIPYLGYLAAFAKTPRGFILLVIVPATIIIYEEIKGLFSEIKKKLKKIDPQLTTYLTTHNPQPIIIIPIIFALLIPLTLSISYFIDRETSSSNIFTVGIPSPTPTIPVTVTLTPTPTPTGTPVGQTLIMNEILPDSSCVLGQTEGQFVELWNGTSGTVNLKNFKLSDGTNTIAISNSNTDLTSHAFAILVKSEGVINQCIGDVHGAVTVNLGGQVDLGIGQLRLLDAGDSVVDTVLWGTSPNPTPAQNQSIERDPTGHDSDTGTGFTPSDFVIRATPSPGQ